MLIQRCWLERTLTHGRTFGLIGHVNFKPQIPWNIRAEGIAHSLVRTSVSTLLEDGGHTSCVLVKIHPILKICSQSHSWQLGLSQDITQLQTPGSDKRRNGQISKGAEGRTQHEYAWVGNLRVLDEGAWERERGKQESHHFGRVNWVPSSGVYSETVVLQWE